MKGSIRERKSTSRKSQKAPKSWEIQVYTGKIDPATGKRERYFETFKGDHPAAERRLRRVLHEIDENTFARVPSKMTVANVLQMWLDSYVKTNCDDRTKDSYESLIRLHVAPGLGRLPLRTITAPLIQEFYGRTLEKGLSRNTVHHIHRALSQGMKWAQMQGYIARNPCTLVTVKVPRSVVMRTLTPAELSTLLEAGKGDYYYSVVYTAVSSGLRQSELLGLRWRDVDLDLCTISVNRVLHKRRGVLRFKVPKTAHSRRRVDMTPKLAAFLREYRKQREVVYLDLGRILSLDDLVFESVNFGAVDPGVLSHSFHRLVVKAGLSGVRFHDLRHTFASICLLRGVPPKVISEALGHASVAFTMDVYSHIIEGMQRSAMALLDDVLPDGVKELQRQINGKAL